MILSESLGKKIYKNSVMPRLLINVIVNGLTQLFSF